MTFQLRHIVAGVDFSDCSQASLRLASQMAAKFSATLSVVHAIPPAGEHSPLSEAIYMPAPSKALAAVETKLTEMVRQAIGRQPMPPLRIIEGHAADGILFAASYEQADLIFLGTRGLGSGGDRLTLGSIAEQVLRRSMTPVLTTCPRRFTKRKPETIRRIAVPADDSPSSARALRTALAIGRTFEAEIVAMPVAGVRVAVPRGIRTARERVTGVNDILRYVDEEAIDLIVIGASRERFADETVFGATLERVTRHAPCAVLSVVETPPQGRATSG